MTVTLRPYQKEALDSIINSELNNITKQLVVLPTGSGKTILFSHLPLIRPNTLPMLVLAHREELLYQAMEKIHLANPDLTIAIEQAENKAGLKDVVVASVATLGRNNTPRILEYDKNYFKTIIIDEAHHSAAPSYRRIIDYFNPDFLLGVTATPQRSDSTRLTDVFQEIVYYKSIQDLIKEGWLCPLIGYRVNTKTDITKVEMQNGEYNQAQLENEINNDDRNLSIITAYNDLANSTKTIVFAAGVNHAKTLAEAFTKAGIAAKVILGVTPSEERREILSGFRSGVVKVIVNVGVLTEGFDEPSIQTIILAKPTRSTLLYTQIVGRGTRLFPDKQHCTIIDISDTTKGKKPVGLPTLLGLPADFDLKGKSFTEVAEEFEELKAYCPGEAVRVLTPEDIKLAYKRIDLFMPPPPNEYITQYSKFVWAEIGEDDYRLSVSNTESMKIHLDPLGRWAVKLITRSEFTILQERLLGYVEDIREAFARSDRWIMKNKSSSVSLIDSTSVWRSDSPTAKQVSLLKSMGVPVTSDMTKGTASMIIDRIIQNDPDQAKRAKQRQYWKSKKY